jgi:hypothetical protein
MSNLHTVSCSLFSYTTFQFLPFFFAIVTHDLCATICVLGTQEKIVLAQVAVHEAATMEHSSHNTKRLLVRSFPALDIKLCATA